MPSVDEYLARLEHPFKAGVLALRETILGVDSRIAEEVKWNAPSFRLEDHFATFRLHPMPVLQLVLHTGARPKGVPRRFQIDDPDGLLTWAAGDRCSLSFLSDADALGKRDAVRKIVEAWIGQL